MASSWSVFAVPRSEIVRLRDAVEKLHLPEGNLYLWETLAGLEEQEPWVAFAISESDGPLAEIGDLPESFFCLRRLVVATGMSNTSSVSVSLFGGSTHLLERTVEDEEEVLPLIWQLGFDVPELVDFGAFGTTLSELRGDCFPLSQPLADLEAHILPAPSKLSEPVESNLDPSHNLLLFQYVLTHEGSSILYPGATKTWEESAEIAQGKANLFFGSDHGDAVQAYVDALLAMGQPDQPQTCALRRRLAEACREVENTEAPVAYDAVVPPVDSDPEALFLEILPGRALSPEFASIARGCAAAGVDWTSWVDRMSVSHPDFEFMLSLCPRSSDAHFVERFPEAPSRFLRHLREHPAVATYLVKELTDILTVEGRIPIARGLPPTVVKGLVDILDGTTDPRDGRKAFYAPYGQKWLEDIQGLAIDALGHVATPEALQALLDLWKREERSGWRARIMLALARHLPIDGDPERCEAFTSTLPTVAVATFLRKPPLPEVLGRAGGAVPEPLVRWLMMVLLLKPAGYSMPHRRPTRPPYALEALRKHLAIVGREALAAHIEAHAVKPSHQALVAPAVAWLRDHA